MHLKDFRRQEKLSQRAFGQLLNPPASPSLISQWECGTTRVTLDYSLEICRVTNGSVTAHDCSSMYAGASSASAAGRQVAA